MTLAVAAVVLVVGSVVATSGDAAQSAASGFVGLTSPRRVVETRAGESTFDGQLQGIGKRAAGSTLKIPIAGRVGIPTDASAVVVNVAVTEPGALGFATLYPCDAKRPTASYLNYAAGQTIPNLVIASVGSGGDICLYTLAQAHFVVDATGYFPTGAYEGLDAPKRVLDSRPGESTADGEQAGIGIRKAGSTLKLQIAGRVGIPADAPSAVLNVTASGASQPGFAVVYPCDAKRPTASNLNYAQGETIPNAVVSKLDPSGAVCLYTLVDAHYIVDVAGVLPDATFQPLPSPLRLLETRPGEVTFDGKFEAIGLRAAGSSTRVRVTGRGGVPASATAVVLNVTATETQAPGFATLFPMGSSKPNASNLNYDRAGRTIPNAVIAKVGFEGNVCLFTTARSHYIIDVAGYLLGDPPPTSGSDCPKPPPTTTTTTTTVPEPPPPAASFAPGQFLVGSQVPPGRYEMDAGAGCYWERQSGLGGTSDEIIANDFRGFAGRVLVDIQPTDRAFEFDSDCGRMSAYVNSSAPTVAISPGSHIVGEHIQPGTYVSIVGDGCYWERLSGFGGDASAIIANDFVSTGGQQFVEILGSDTGFYSDADCGTWSRL